MEYTNIISSIKIIAKAIEKKSPGSCTDIINGIDNLQSRPQYAKKRMEDLKEKWDDVKDRFSEHELNQISAESGIDVSDPATWNYPTGPLLIDDESVSGFDEILSDIVDFIKSIFD